MVTPLVLQRQVKCNGIPTLPLLPDITLQMELLLAVLAVRRLILPFSLKRSTTPLRAIRSRLKLVKLRIHLQAAPVTRRTRQIRTLLLLPATSASQKALLQASLPARTLTARQLVRVRLA